MFRKSSHLLAGLVAIASLGSLVASPSYANPSVRFECDATGSLPTTVAVNRVTGQALPVIFWYSQFFADSGYDSLTRCNMVSQKFQKANEAGTLNYVTAGIVNNQPVICTPGLGGACNQGNVLFTLKPETNAAVALQQLFDVRDRGSTVLFESGERRYVNIQDKINTLNSGGNAGNQKPDTPTIPVNQTGNSQRTF